MNAQRRKDGVATGRVVGLKKVGKVGTAVMDVMMKKKMVGEVGQGTRVPLGMKDAGVTVVPEMIKMDHTLRVEADGGDLDNRLWGSRGGDSEGGGRWGSRGRDIPENRPQRQESKPKAEKTAQVAIDVDNHGIEIKGPEVGLSKAKIDTGKIIYGVEKKANVMPSEESTPKKQDSIKEMARFSQPNYHLMVMLGDITNLKVDVLVNAANKELQHAGGLAKAIVDKGGKSIQRDCDEHIKRYSRLMEGDVYLGKPGNLKCNFIAHAVGPVWQGGRNNEEEMLREAGLKSMEEANDHNQTSIALPDLGAGVYGYPANKSTRTIVEAVDDFYRDNPGCCIRDVYLCDVSQKTVDLFITAVQNRFGTGNVIVSGHGGGARDKWSAPQAKPRKGWNQAVQGAGRNPTPGNTSSFAVMIYGKDQIVTSMAIRDLENKLDEMLRLKIITDDIIKTFTPIQENELIKKLEEQFQVEATFEKSKSRIQLIGLADSLPEAADMVHGLILNVQRLNQAAQETQLTVFYRE
ncbi:Poly [ADP-ribose] polymerase 14 [Mizuhopecten yessoensis]|uniref:Poly [ADP-ribose] polymerase 14 n=1 Tax=Mizuhopecten yessoensis TaxID=6573 RepID=A0A210QG87_MIZYE|nr:Poly [ADP-ribose] polymerase 14 [Mizuhopecten yessoensis]